MTTRTPTPSAAAAVAAHPAAAAAAIARAREIWTQAGAVLDVVRELDMRIIRDATPDDSETLKRWSMFLTGSPALGERALHIHASVDADDISVKLALALCKGSGANVSPRYLDVIRDWGCSNQLMLAYMTTMTATRHDMNMAAFVALLEFATHAWNVDAACAAENLAYAHVIACALLTPSLLPVWLGGDRSHKLRHIIYPNGRNGEVPFLHVGPLDYARALARRIGVSQVIAFAFAPRPSEQIAAEAVRRAVCWPASAKPLMNLIQTATSNGLPWRSPYLAMFEGMSEWVSEAEKRGFRLPTRRQTRSHARDLLMEHGSDADLVAYISQAKAEVRRELLVAGAKLDVRIQVETDNATDDASLAIYAAALAEYCASTQHNQPLLPAAELYETAVACARGSRPDRATRPYRASRDRPRWLEFKVAITRLPRGWHAPSATKDHYDYNDLKRAYDACAGAGVEPVRVLQLLLRAQAMC